MRAPQVAAAQWPDVAPDRLSGGVGSPNACDSGTPCGGIGGLQCAGVPDHQPGQAAQNRSAERWRGTQRANSAPNHRGSTLTDFTLNFDDKQGRHGAVAATARRSIGVLSWAPGSTLWIRGTERNDAGNAHGMGLDKVRFSASGSYFGQPLPEPGPLALAAGGLPAAAAMRRRQR